MVANRQGEIDYEELRCRAEEERGDESDHDVQVADFAWGRGYRSSWTGPGLQHSTEKGTMSVQYQVVSSATGSTICGRGRWGWLGCEAGGSSTVHGFTRPVTH